MAIVRCPDHSPRPRKRVYEMSVEPIGYPETALVCGSKGCETPGLVWLSPKEADAYRGGEIVFEAFSGSMMKMRVR